jgi:hypothetical protein
VAGLTGTGGQTTLEKVADISETSTKLNHSEKDGK